MSKVYISLGSNLGNTAQNLETGINLIEAQIGTLQQKSSIYQTAPWGFTSFNNFLNQVAIFETELPANFIMHMLLQIEHQMGRNRELAGYADRIIDLDILLLGQSVIHTDDLEIPHPRMHLRKFVLLPMAEIEPNLMHPTLLKTMAELLSQCPDQTKATKL